MPRGENAIRECKKKLPMPKISLCWLASGRKRGYVQKKRNPSQETNANIPDIWRKSQRLRIRRTGLEAFVACAADFGLGHPFRGEHLVRGEATGRYRIEDRVDDVTTLSLRIVSVVSKQGQI